MALPKQVEQQLKEVEQIEQHLQAQGEPQKTEELELKQEPQPQPTEEAAPTQVVEQKQPEVQEDPKWEQKYRTLDGKYRAEVPQLHSQVKELTNQLQTALQSIEELKRPKQPEQPQEHLVTDKDRDAYGEDMIDVMERVTKQVLREHVTPLESELAKRDERIAKLEAQLQKTGGDVTTMTFEQRLYKAVPDFDQINVDPKWIDWLEEIDMFTGEPRRTYAEFVYNNGDVEKVSKIVALFKASQGPTPTQTQRQAELERQVTPTRATSTVTPTESKKFYTEAEVSAQFNKVRQLNMQGKHDEANRLEAELSNAYVEGRVRS